MVGYTTGEGMIFDLMARQLKDFRDVVPWLFGYQRDAPDTRIAADKIKKYYLGDGEISPETVSHMYNVSRCEKFSLSEVSNSSCSQTSSFFMVSM